MVYTSSSLPLAILESLVHMDERDVTAAFVAIAAEIPDAVDIARVRPTGLPKNWRYLPGPRALADVGTRWAQGLGTPVLAVPSAVVPQEVNYLLNPLHPQFKRIRIGRPEPFAFDPRLWKS